MNTVVAPAQRTASPRPPKPIRPPGPVARPKQVAWLLGVHIDTVYDWAKKYPDFPKSTLVGARARLYNTAEVIAWRDSRGLKP
jgi:predicted DNA-binding transcriptional regulator AlpA